jgi:hypothetical protein
MPEPRPAAAEQAEADPSVQPPPEVESEEPDEAADRSDEGGSEPETPTAPPSGADDEVSQWRLVTDTSSRPTS